MPNPQASPARDVVLYDYWRSSASYRVRIALNLAGIAYDRVPVDLVAGAQRSDAHLARNPQGLVPVLDIDGVRLTQSLAILDYLDRSRNLNLLPPDPAERAKAQALAHAIAVDLHPVCNLSVAKHATALTGGAADMPGALDAAFYPAGIACVRNHAGRVSAGPFLHGHRAGPGRSLPDTANL